MASKSFVSNDNMTELMTGIDNKLDTKVDKVSGKGLSKNDYTDTDKAKVDALGTASAKNVPASGDASSTEVVLGSDTRLTNARPASDVSAWAKASTKPAYTATEVGAIPATQKGANGGVAELDENGKVPSAQLPSYVDDVVNGYYKAADGKFYKESTYTTEIPGESDKIYISLDTNKTYRWSGTAFVVISETLSLGETSSTAYAGNKGKANATAIAGIKNGAEINSFAQTESALADKISKSSTAGLVKNDGTIDTNTYLTAAGITGKADKVASATNGHLAKLDANGNLADSGVAASSVLKKSSTAGLVKNDGTIDTNQYLTSVTELSAAQVSALLALLD